MNTDRQTNGAHAQHYVNAAAQNHGTITRLLEELAQARERIAYLESRQEWPA